MKPLREKVADACEQSLGVALYMGVQAGLLAYCWWHNWDPPDSHERSAPTPEPESEEALIQRLVAQLDTVDWSQAIRTDPDDVYGEE